jgi:hypothetical protein
MSGRTVECRSTGCSEVPLSPELRLRGVDRDRRAGRRPNPGQCWYLNRLAIAAGAGLGALLAAATGAAWASAGIVAPCDPVRDICGLDRPEDLSQIGGTQLLLASTAAPGGPLVIVDPRTRTVRTLRLEPAGDRRLGAADCAGPPARWRVGGHDLRRIGATLRGAVVNRPDAGTVRIELFELSDPQAATGRWRGCVIVPDSINPNDVALGVDGALYVSHMFSSDDARDRAAQLRERFLSGLATGAAFSWAAASGWRPVPGTEVSFANGVAVSETGDVLAVAGTYSRLVVLVHLRSGRTQRVPLPLQPDNLTREHDGGFLVAGHTGEPVRGIDPCRDPRAWPCGFPSAVASIDPRRRVSTLYAHDGSRVPGPSVALRIGATLYLGSAFGDRVTVIAPERAPATPAVR